MTHDRNARVTTAWEHANTIEMTIKAVKEDCVNEDVDCALRHITELRSTTMALEDELRNGNLGQERKAHDA